MRSGGSLGWKTRGSLIKEFEDVAYGLEVSTTGNPKWGEVKTREGVSAIIVVNQQSQRKDTDSILHSIIS